MIIESLSRKVLSRCDSLMGEKASLVGKCKAAAEAVKKAADATAASVEAARAEAEAEATAARRTWREGESGRRQRFLARKAEDAKEATLRGLQPEVTPLF